MKKLILLLSIITVSGVNGQVQFPKASPVAKLEQKVGLTDVKISYSRPGKKGRTIFGDLLPFGELWRTGANENTLFRTSDPITFGKDTLQKGTYSIFTKPGKETWEIIFYKDSVNWGTPDIWEDAKVALKTTAKVKTTTDVIETFTISIDNFEKESATLNFAWDHTITSVQFTTPTNKKVMAAIDKLMAGPTAGEYYNAGNYYFKEKKDLKQALTWVSKACEMQGDQAYWMFNTKAQIQAELGDKKGAITTAKIALKAAEADKNNDYVKMIKTSIETWSK